MPVATHTFNEGEQTVVLHLQIAKNEYMNLVDKKLKEVRKNFQQPGFRPGKAPMGLLRKKFGNEILWDEVNKLLDQEVRNFIQEKELKVLGNPMPQNSLETNINKPVDVQLDIEIGYMPKQEIAGISEDTAFPFYKVEMSETELAEEIEAQRKQRSQDLSEDATDIQDNDLLEVKVVANNEAAWTNESTMVAMDKATADVQAQLKAIEVGGNIVCKLSDLDTALTAERRMGMFFPEVETEEEDVEVTAEVLKVKRQVPRELNEEFFAELFPEDEIKTEEEFKAKFAEMVSGQFEPAAKSIYFRYVYEELMEKNNFDLPEKFLRKWLEESREEKQEEVNDDNFADFMRRLRWSLIIDQLTNEHNVEVSQQEVEHAIRMAIARQYNFQIPPYHPIMDSQIENLMKDEATVRQFGEQVQEQKVFDALFPLFGKAEETVDAAKFDEIYKARFEQNEEATSEEEVVEEVEAEDAK